MMNSKERIAKRVALELKDGDLVNLGIGLPTLVANHLPRDINVMFQSENGFTGLDRLNGEPIPQLVNAGGQPCGMIAGAAMFDSAFSFSLIRGGHINVSVLGGLQVDEEGNLANWMVPGKMVPGMGGAMDLVVGSQKVIVAMEHCAKDGSSKILQRCTLPLTAPQCVDMIVTELAVFSFKEGQIYLDEYAPDITLEQIKACTPANYLIFDDVKPMQLNND